MMWKKGRGKLGIFEPLLGRWEADADSQMGPVHCTRRFTRVLGGTYIRLQAIWTLPDDKHYEELALFGTGPDKFVRFWSFTSDGKQSVGQVADVSDLHPDAVGFEAEMPAGVARQAYWPDEAEGFHWVVESRTKKGWNRMVHHHYRPLAE